MRARVIDSNTNFVASETLSGNKFANAVELQNRKRYFNDFAPLVIPLKHHGGQADETERIELFRFPSRVEDDSAAPKTFTGVRLDDIASS